MRVLKQPVVLCKIAAIIVLPDTNRAAAITFHPLANFPCEPHSAVALLIDSTNLPFHVRISQLSEAVDGRSNASKAR
jgi:hypothetical protein